MGGQIDQGHSRGNGGLADGGIRDGIVAVR
jgi:hypothetical protein